MPPPRPLLLHRSRTSSASAGSRSSQTARRECREGARPRDEGPRWRARRWRQQSDCSEPVRLGSGAERVVRRVVRTGGEEWRDGGGTGGQMGRGTEGQRNRAVRGQCGLVRALSVWGPPPPRTPLRAHSGAGARRATLRRPQAAAALPRARGLEALRRRRRRLLCPPRHPSRDVRGMHVDRRLFQSMTEPRPPPCDSACPGLPSLP